MIYDENNICAVYVRENGQRVFIGHIRRVPDGDDWRYETVTSTRRSLGFISGPYAEKYARMRLEDAHSKLVAGRRRRQARSRSLRRAVV